MRSDISVNGMDAPLAWRIRVNRWGASTPSKPFRPVIAVAWAHS
jgi:hypothetical protein